MSVGVQQAVRGLLEGYDSEAENVLGELLERAHGYKVYQSLKESLKSIANSISTGL